MITLVVLCLLTLELEGSLCKPISLPNMVSAAQKAKAALAAAQKAKAAEAPETVPDESQQAGPLTASLFPDTQVDQPTLVEESPSLAMSPDAQARDSLEGGPEEVAPHPTPPSPQSKDIVCI